MEKTNHSEQNKNNIEVKDIKALADYCFEVSWEVCNKVGGINTVLKTKATHMLDFYKKDHYYMIGPYFHDKLLGMFEEKAPPDWLKDVFRIMENKGIVCHFGEWLIDGEPNVILLDFEEYAHKNKDKIKYYLWEKYKIDSLNTKYHDWDEPILWGCAVGELLAELSHRELKDKRVVVHAHEWLSGGALFFLDMNNIPFAKVFTTHATMLGRAIASRENLYAILENINPLEKAKEYDVVTKYQTELALAKLSDVFSTVSEITGIEAKHLLGRYPDILLYNGIDIENFPTFEEISIKHRLYKNTVQEFILYYFFPYYDFDIEESLTYFICGRYEFHDKGIDLFIMALAKLNEMLKKDQELGLNPKTIVAFIWVPANVRGVKPEIIENKTNYLDIKESINEVKNKIFREIIYDIITERDIKKERLFYKDFLRAIRSKVLKFKKVGKPPISTHDLVNEDKDLIINKLKELGLDNRKENMVKVVYYPIYLTGADGLLDTSYYESIMASHLGVFPSYYEPWGYTPLECSALGVPAVTTDLAGFGRYIMSKTDGEGRNRGIFILPRYDVDDEVAADELAKIMYRFANLSRAERVKNKIIAKDFAETCSWKDFIKYYIKAHNMALERIGKI